MSSPKLRILELFSGVGGMHFALDAACPGAEVALAVDVSDVANKVYRHNFGSARHRQGNICGISAESVNKLGVNAILMSPPCQPFTRQGLQRDLSDARTEPLTHVIGLLPSLPGLEFVLVENVKGFETSEARLRLVEALDTIGFHRREMLLSPSHFGVPNSRLRYFLVARRTGNDFDFGSRDRLIDGADENSLAEILPRLPASLQRRIPASLSDYLNPEVDDDLLLPDPLLLRYCQVLDLVHPSSSGSCCFTKAYGKFVEGTGSVLVQSGDVDAVYSRLKELEDPDDRLRCLRELRLRYFSPREIARLMGFPDKFDFPPETTTVQRYRLLGNSLNVEVVAGLIHLMISS